MNLEKYLSVTPEIQAALAEGKLSQTRYDSYCAMYEEVKDVKDWQRPKV